MIIIGCFFNNFILYKLDRTAVNIISSNPDLEILDKVSCYGKLNGNGNGTQFFGAFLVYAKSKTAMESVVNEMLLHFEIADFAQQDNNEIHVKYLEHRNLQFTFTDDMHDSYYIIYYFNSRHPLSNKFDLLGY